MRSKSKTAQLKSLPRGRKTSGRALTKVHYPSGNDDGETYQKQALHVWQETRSLLAEIRTLLDGGFQRNSALPASVSSASVAAAPNKQAAYWDILQRVRTVVERAVPPHATVLVVNKGDPELLKLGARKAWHFPQDHTGGYAGHYPADSAAAIAQLQALRIKGAGYVIFPATAFWWLSHYKELCSYLEQCCSVVVREEGVCVVFALSEPRVTNGLRTGLSGQSGYPYLVRHIRELLANTLPQTAQIAVVNKGDPELLQLGQCTACHFPLAEDGRYAGFYPPDDKSAIAAVQLLVAKGVQFMVFPESAFWWLDHYLGLRRYLETQGRLLLEREYACKVFDLRKIKCP